MYNAIVCVAAPGDQGGHAKSRQRDARLRPAITTKPAASRPSTSVTRRRRINALRSSMSGRLTPAAWTSEEDLALAGDGSRAEQSSSTVRTAWARGHDCAHVSAGLGPAHAASVRLLRYVDRLRASSIGINLWRAVTPFAAGVAREHEDASPRYRYRTSRGRVWHFGGRARLCRQPHFPAKMTVLSQSEVLRASKVRGG